jgi:hypothetical protein
MAYDTMGNYTGDYTAVDPYATETEEEKRLRLQREADEAARAQAAATPVKETRIIDPRTGEVKLKIEGNERDLTAANPVTPTVVKPGDYNAYTAQQESGANPNIGYHYPANAQGQRKSSAYGTYGITANAYKDIQAANPAFANRPLESLTQEEQTQANNTYRGVLAQQLQAKGVDPTEENTRLAHLLGATGAARYLQNKTVSAQAAAANGGPERLKQIAEARRAGQPAPASGAAVAQQPPAPPAPAVPVQPQMQQQPAPAAPVNPEQALAPGSAYSLAQGQPTTGIQVPGMNTVPLTQGEQLPMAQQRFQQIQDNPQELLAMRNDTSMPEHLRKRAGERAYELLNNERQRAAAEQKFQEMVAAGDGKAIANAVQGRGAKGEEGSFLKMIALGFISPELAGAEAIKLGLGPTKYEQSTIANPDGTQTAIEIKKSSDGRIQAAYRMDGTPLTSQELNRLNSGVNLDIVGGSYVNDRTGEIGRLVSDKKTGQSYIQTDTGRKGMTGFRPQSSGGSLDMQRVAQVQQQNIKLAGDWAKLQMQVQSAAPEAANKFLGQFNAEHGTNYTLSQLGGSAPQISLETGQLTAAPVPAPVPQVTAPAPAPVQQAPAPQVTAPAPAPAPAIPSASTPANVIAGKEAAKEQRTADVKVSTAEREEFVKHKATVQDAAEAGRQVAQVTRTQINDLMNDPAIIGIMNGTGTQYAAAGKLIREMAAGAYSEDESGKRLADDIRGLSISQPQKDAISRYAQLNTQINRATLKANTGGGGVSNAEQAANKAANMTNIGDLTPFAALNGLGRRQYQGDLTQEKAAMMATGQYQTRAQFDQAWQKTEDQRIKQYDAIYRERLNLIKPFAEKANANPNDAQAQQRYRDAAIHAFRVYPNPEYTAGSGWTFKTKQSKLAAMAAVAGDR